MDRNYYGHFNETQCRPSMMNDKDIETAHTSFTEHAATRTPDPSRNLAIWITTNLLATVAIVNVNRSILSSPSFSKCPFSFVAYHLAITTLVLNITSQRSIAMFTPSRTSLISILPLILAMCMNVVLLNLSLAHNSIICYQIVRILLTPLTALINFFFYGWKLPINAVLALIPTCLGVGLVSYYSLPEASTTAAPESLSTKHISTYGIVFAFSGVVCSAVYTVLISHYHSRLRLSSLQLLYNQAPFGAVLLAFISFFTDTFPVWSTVTVHQWLLLSLSGGCACIINLSLFFIVNDVGPVSSTVVGHLKTCLIVGLGWAMGAKELERKGILGILLAIWGIILYSLAIYRKNTAYLGLSSPRYQQRFF